MKIVEVINSLRAKGGAEVFYTQLIHELKKHNNVDIYAIVLYSGFHPDYSDFVSEMNDHIVFLNKRKFIDFKAFKAFKLAITKINPDIIHFHNASITSYIMSFGYKKRSWNLFLTVHNMATKETNTLNRLLRKPLASSKRLVFVGISDRITETIRAIEKKALIETIYNGVAMEDISKYKNEKIYDFVCVARFSRQKNHALLIEAFNEYYKKNPCSKLICVGDGELLDETKKKVDELECSNNIIFTGSLKNPYEYLSKSKIFVLSSTYEGNPISILEAMQFGLPVIAPLVGGVPDIVKDKRNGLLFDVGDCNGLISSMAIISKDNKLYKRIKEFNLEDCKQYGMHHCAISYLDMFHKYKKEN